MTIIIIIYLCCSVILKWNSDPYKYISLYHINSHNVILYLNMRSWFSWLEIDDRVFFVLPVLMWTASFLPQIPRNAR